MFGDMNKLYLTLLILLLVGCGSRKSEVERLKLEIKQQREMVLSIQNNIQSNVRLHKVATKTTAEPINENKISTFNGTSFQNARITIEETESDSTANVNDQSKTDVKMKEESETNVKDVNRDVESKKNNPYLWIAVTLLGAFLIWRLLKTKP